MQNLFKAGEKYMFIIASIILALPIIGACPFWSNNLFRTTEGDVIGWGALFAGVSFLGIFGIYLTQIIIAKNNGANVLIDSLLISTLFVIFVLFTSYYKEDAFDQSSLIPVIVYWAIFFGLVITTFIYQIAKLRSFYIPLITTIILLIILFYFQSGKIIAATESSYIEYQTLSNENIDFTVSVPKYFTLSNPDSVKTDSLSLKTSSDFQSQKIDNNVQMAKIDSFYANKNRYIKSKYPYPNYLSFYKLTNVNYVPSCESDLYDFGRKNTDSEEGGQNQTFEKYTKDDISYCFRSNEERIEVLGKYNENVGQFFSIYYDSNQKNADNIKNYAEKIISNGLKSIK